MAKPAKKSASKLPPKNKKRLIIVAIIAACMLLVAALFVIQRSIYEHEKAILRDDITFARYETFIDLVKQRLDTEMPEGKWVIDKYCDYSHAKLSKEGLACWYGIESTENIDNEKFYMIISSFSENGALGKTASKVYPESRYFKGDITAFCSANGVSQSSTAGVSCSRGSLTIRYPLLYDFS